MREEKKVNAGAQFFQTKLIFDPGGLEIWLEELDKRNFLDKVYILAGVTPIRSCRMARYLHENIPGVKVPAEILWRYEKAREDDFEEIGIEIALKIIERIKGIKGINGLHLMSVDWEIVVPRLLKEAGLVA